MLNRRKLLQMAAVTASGAVLPKQSVSSEPFSHSPSTSGADISNSRNGLPAEQIAERPGAGTRGPGAAPFVFCMNMATIRGHNLGFVKELQTCAKAGFSSVEIWMDSLQTYLEKGGSVRDAAALIKDLGLTVENCVGFAEWIVDDDARRNKAVEQLKREMDLLAGIGCTRVAAPPMGATEGTKLNLQAVTERYRRILDIGEEKGVIPQLELWGFSNNLKHVSEVMYVAMESAHPAAKVLLDVYHLFRGGSSLDTLHFVNTSGMDVFHINDYPANIPAADMKDADRVYPGDGIAPLDRILPLMRKEHTPLVLSFEVFNPAYYKQDALLVAQTSLRKMKAAVGQV